jgi:hypothetical protein
VKTVGAASSRSCRAARRPTVMRPGIAGASAAGLAVLRCGAENDAHGLSVPWRPAHRSPASKHVAGLFWALRRRRLSGVVLSGPREEHKRRRNPVFYVPRRFCLRDGFRKPEALRIMGALMNDAILRRMVERVTRPRSSTSRTRMDWPRCLSLMQTGPRYGRATFTVASDSRARSLARSVSNARTGWKIR